MERIMPSTATSLTVEQRLCRYQARSTHAGALAKARGASALDVALECIGAAFSPAYWLDRDKIEAQRLLETPDSLSMHLRYRRGAERLLSLDPSLEFTLARLDRLARDFKRSPAKTELRIFVGITVAPHTIRRLRIALRWLRRNGYAAQFSDFVERIAAPRAEPYAPLRLQAAE
jgi:hypothetical protein